MCSICVGLMFSLLLGCATTYQDKGTVVDKQPFSLAHAKSATPIKKRAVQAGLIGATAGATVGGAFGLLGASITPSASAAGWTAACASGGALLSGGVGLFLGGGFGLAEYALRSSEKDVWQYKVKSLNGPKTFIINQEAPSIPLHAKVNVIKKNGALLIKPIRTVNAH